MNYNRIKLEFKDELAIIELNHPEVLNAISIEMLNELKSAVSKVSHPQSGARCLIITGAGRGFCSGANLSETSLGSGEADSQDMPFSLNNTYNPFFLMLKDMSIPIVTAVQGPVAGIGMSLALMGDIVIAGRSAYFLQAFRNVGLIPDGGITWLLPRLIGFSRAMELSMLAEKLPAEKALEWGLINRVVEDEQLLVEAMKLAKQLSTGPTVALGLLRKAYWASNDNTYEQQLHLESRGQEKTSQTEDALEGILAFREKRPTAFKGK